MLSCTCSAARTHARIRTGCTRSCECLCPAPACQEPISRPPTTFATPQISAETAKYLEEVVAHLASLPAAGSGGDEEEEEGEDARKLLVNNVLEVRCCLPVCAEAGWDGCVFVCVCGGGALLLQVLKINR